MTHADTASSTGRTLNSSAKQSIRHGLRLRRAADSGPAANNGRATAPAVADMRSLLALLSESRLRPHIDSRFVLVDIDAAMFTLAEGRQFGRIALAIP